MQDVRYKSNLVSLAVRLLVNKYVKEKDAETGFVEPIPKPVIVPEAELPPTSFPISLYDNSSKTIASKNEFIKKSKLNKQESQK